MAELNRELADFLRRARAAVDPARAGLPADDRVRRVPGLRREEVALLAGVSTDYYTRLEQGRRIVPSTGVVDAIARALDLDAAGRQLPRELEHVDIHAARIAVTRLIERGCVCRQHRNALEHEHPPSSSIMTVRANVVAACPSATMTV